MPILQHPCGTRLIFNRLKSGLVAILAYDDGLPPERMGVLQPGQAEQSWWARLDEGFVPMNNGALTS